MKTNGVTAINFRRICIHVALNALLMFALLAASGSSAAEAEKEKKTLSFHAIDAQTGKPIADMKLKVNGTSASKNFREEGLVTDAGGKCRIEFPGTDVTHLIIWTSRDGYPPHTIAWRQRHNDVIPEAYVHKVDPGVLIGGIVRDNKGKAVGSAKVSIRGPGTENTPDAREHLALWNHEEVTNAEGRWTCSHVPADFGKKIGVEVRHEDYAPASFLPDEREKYYLGPRIPTADFVTKTAVLEIKAGKALRGVVVDAEGKGIGSANVLLGSRYARIPETAITDAEGRFSFGNLRERAEDTLTVKAEGFAPELKTVKLDSDPIPEVRFELKPGGLLKGRVVDAEGKPMADVRVSVEFWRGVQTLEWGGRTDAEGRFSWDSAPTDMMQGYIGKSGYVQLRNLSFAGDGVEKTYTLKPTPKVRGRVVDAETKAPIAKFRVTQGEARGSTVNWSRSDMLNGRDGEFSMSFSEAGRHQLKIEAEGYVPMISKVLDLDQPDQQLDFELSKGGGPTGVVLLPNGEPASGAEVALHLKGKSLHLGLGLFEQRSSYGSCPIVNADKEGRFKLPADPEGTNVIAVHAQGFAEASPEELAASKKLTLRPWGTIEGTLRIGKLPGTNEVLKVVPKRNGPYDLQYSQEFQATTDNHGRFKFTRVPPGENRLIRLVPFGKGSRGYSHATRIDVKAGDTTRVELGGTGRMVVGKAVVSSQDRAIDWQADHHYLSTIRPRPPKQFETREEAEAWQNSPEVKKANENYRSFTLRFAEDGSFRGEDIPPGTYELRIALREPRERGALGMGKSLGSLTKEVVVPEAAGAETDAPADLGIFEVPLDKQIKVGQLAPNFEIKTVDGKPLKLADFRGKYVLLDFWATWCGPCIAELPHMKATYDRFGTDERFVMLGLSLDDKEEAPKKFAAKNSIAWIQGFLGDWAKTKVPSDYGVTGIPSVFLVGPDGKIVAKDLRGSAVEAAVGKALAGK